jgi:type IV pilus assembly protein PilW
MKVNAGFSLLELLIALTIGSVITSLALRVYNANHQLFLTNKALENVFYDGQYIIPLLHSNIQQAGYSNVYSADLNTQVDINQEANFITAYPIATELSFSLYPLIASLEGGDAPDQITINTSADKSCTGSNFDFNDGELFHVVNQYYLEETTLRCKSYDGRYLRGLKSNGGYNYSVSLLENVYDLQIQYLIKVHAANDGNSSNSERFVWVNANQLSTYLSAVTELVAVNLAVLIGSPVLTKLQKHRQVRLLSNDSYEAPENILVRQFSTIITLNNNQTASNSL